MSYLRKLQTEFEQKIINYKDYSIKRKEYYSLGNDDKLEIDKKYQLDDLTYDIESESYIIKSRDFVILKYNKEIEKTTKNSIISEKKQRKKDFAVFMFIILLFAGGIFLTTTSSSSIDPKAAGEKAGKEVCEKVKSGSYSLADQQKFIKKYKENVDDPADFQIWLEGFYAAYTSCIK